jgi:hypothetical protein
VPDWLSSKCEALSSNPSTTKKKKKAFKRKILHFQIAVVGQDKVNTPIPEGMGNRKNQRKARPKSSQTLNPHS